MSERPAARHPQVLLAKMLVVPLASLCLAGVATKPAWAASPCIREGVTLVCKRADRDLRIIHDTLSPSGRYGFAWGFSTGDWADRTLEKDDRDGSYYARDRSGVENYLVRVSDSEILKRLAGSHFGDRLEKAAAEQLARQGEKISADEADAALLEANAVRNDGTIDVTVRFNGEDYEAKIRLAVGQKPDTLDARLISIKQSAK